jgi:hypothetical protein
MFVASSKGQMDYTPKIPKEKLEHGGYYLGRCRNAHIARWNGKTQKFSYWRCKFGNLFIEEINAPENDKIMDVFVADKRLYEHQGARWIPFDDDGLLVRDLKLVEEPVANDFFSEDMEGLTTAPLSYLPFVERVLADLNALEDNIFAVGRDVVSLPPRLFRQLLNCVQRLKRLEKIIAAKDASLPDSK